MKTKTLISRFNKVSGYDFNTLKEWSITPQAVLERTGCEYLEDAYLYILLSTRIEKYIVGFASESAEKDLEYYKKLANSKLEFHEIAKNNKQK